MILFRYAASGKRPGIVILILFFSFYFLKMTSPTLPIPNTNRVTRCVTTWFGEIFCTIILCFVIVATRFFYPYKFVIVFLFDSVLRVGFPTYYIYSYPSLSNYVSNSFKKNALNPLKERKENVRKLLSSFKRSPRIDVKVWII